MSYISESRCDSYSTYQRVTAFPHIILCMNKDFHFHCVDLFLKVFSPLARPCLTSNAFTSGLENGKSILWTLCTLYIPTIPALDVPAIISVPRFSSNWGLSSARSFLWPWSMFSTSSEPASGGITRGLRKFTSPHQSSGYKFKSIGPASFSLNWNNSNQPREYSQRQG